MKALTICQPYAGLICDGRKRIENRQWSPSYRGELIIHAGKSHVWMESWDESKDGPYPDPMPFGAVVGRAELTAIYSLDRIKARPGILAANHQWVPEHKHSEGRFLWVLEHVQRLKKPIPWKGAQGLWNADQLVASDAWIFAEFEDVKPVRG